MLLSTGSRFAAGRRFVVTASGLARRADIQLLSVITLAGAVVRFATLGQQSIWTDEALTAGYVQGSLKNMLIGLPRSDANPPLFYLLEWVSVRIFGQGDAGLRTLSGIAGTATIPVLYAIGVSIASRRAALIAAALGAVEPMLWWYSQEARVYALFTLLSALGLLAFVITLRDRSTWALSLWTLCGGLMLTTHYFALLLLIPQAIWLFITWPAGRRGLLLALAGLGVVAVALSGTFALELQQGAGIASLPLDPRLRVLVPQLLASPSPPATLLWIAALALALIGAALALLTTPPAQRHFARVLATFVAIDLVVPILAALAGYDYIVTRNLIATLVPFVVLLGIGFATPRVARAGVAGAAMTTGLWLGAVSTITAEPALQRIDTKAAVASLGPPTVDRVVLSPGTYLFGYVLPRYVTPSSAFVNTPVPVQEIDILIPHPGRGTPPCLAGQTCELFPTQERPGSPAPGFRLVSKREIVPFTVLRWRARKPELLELKDIEASGPQVPHVPPVALYQTP